MPPPRSDGAEAPAARPYGPLGLLVSIVVIFLIAVLILAVIAAVGFGVLAAGSGWKGALRQVVNVVPADASEEFADRMNIVVGAVAYVVTACSILIVARFRGAAKWADLVGWHSWDMAKHVRLLLTLLVGTLCYSLVASSVIEQVYPQAKDWVPTPSGTPWVIGFLALATLLAPITEELLFRGWIYTSLREVIGIRLGILVSATLFALAHWESTHLYAVAVFPVGLALGYVRQRTDSVAASITFHALYNGVAAVLLFVGK